MIIKKDVFKGDVSNISAETATMVHTLDAVTHNASTGSLPFKEATAGVAS